MATVPLEGCTVTAFRWNNDDSSYTNVKSATTDVNGDFEIAALSQGKSYKLKFDHPDYLTVYYSTSGLQESLETGSAFYMETSFSGINVILSAGGTISGNVEAET